MAYLFVAKKGERENISLLDYLDNTQYKDITLLKNDYINNHNVYLYNVEANETFKDYIHNKVLNKEFTFDAFYFDREISLKKKGVLVMDMDMTTVQIEGIDEIARALGLYDDIARITHKAMQGNMDFKESLTKRVSLLEGKSAHVIEDVKKIMVETEGLSYLITTLKKYNWGIGIASGGFTQLINVIKDKYNLDMVCANTLEIKDGLFTGKVLGSIVDAHGKEIALNNFINTRDVDKTQSICIGDGANDLLMIKASNLGVAYKAKEKVQKEVNVCLNYSDLSVVAIFLEMML